MLNIGEPAPLFSGQDVISGQTFSLADHHGDVVVIAFSGLTWCGPCQFEAPILQSLWEEVQGEEFQANLFNPRVQFVMIVVSDGYTTITSDTLQQYGISSIPVLTDPSIKDLYEVAFYPTLFILDTDLNICEKKIGAGGAEDVLREEIRQLIIGCGDQKFWVPAHAMAVAQILFGVTQDGGGLVISGGKPIPIDPWGPFRRLAAEKRDILIRLTISELAGQLSDSKARWELETISLRAIDTAVKQLLTKAARKPISFGKDRMPLPTTPQEKR